MSNTNEARIPATYSRTFGSESCPVEFMPLNGGEPGVYHVFSDAFEGSRCLRKGESGAVELLPDHGLDAVTAARCRASVKSGIRAGAKALKERLASIAPRP